MAKPWVRNTDAREARPTDWRSAMSDHVAYALLVYTALQIFVTTQAMHSKGGHSTLPYFALVLLVALIIPFCRFFERRWTRLDDEAAHDPALAGAFARDRLILWALAIGVPCALTAAIKAILSVA